MKRSRAFPLKPPAIVSVVGYFLATIAVFVVTSFFISYIWISYQHKHLQEDGEHFEQEYLSLQKLEIKSRVHSIKKYLVEEKNLAKDKLEAQLQEKVNQAHQLAESIYLRYNGVRPDSEIQEMIYTALRDLRFNQGRSYYFIGSENGTLRLFPPNPKMENTDPGTYPVAGQTLIKKIQTLLETQDEGFINYEWYTSDGKQLLNKYSFVKKFKPYNLVIGSGDYLELFEAKLREDIYKRIASLAYGPNQEGYFFINSYRGDLYVTNGEYFGGKKNIWDVVDAHGTKVVQENVRLAKENPDGAFSYYTWKKNTGEQAEKVSFILGIDEWEIFIGTGLYTDTFKNKVAEHLAIRKAEFKQELWNTLSIIISTLVIIATLLFIMMRKLSQNLKVFRSNLEDAIHNLTHLNPDEIHFNEFKQVGDSVNQMISGLHKQSAELRHITLHDHLTSLPNRRYVWEQLKEMLSHCQNHDHNAALMFIDLDHFKEINDTLGHSAGDELLRQVSKRFRHVLRSEDLVARLGGDEFTVITGLLHDDEAELITQKLLAQLQSPFEINDHALNITASIGICLFPKDGDSPDTILRNGDSAMYQAKSNGRNGYCFYDACMTEAASRRLNLLEQLNEALKQDQFELYYQPQIGMRTGKIVSAEALIRWNHPERGLIPPDQFIPFAEENGLIRQIGQWVIRQALSDINRWHLQGYNLQKVAVNFSTQQISDTIVAEVSEILKNSAVDAKHIEFEITESALMENPELSRKVLHELNQLGVSLAIDDFGQGYSSLSYLKLFPISKLKIDRDFIRDIEEDENDRALSRAIIALGKSLNLTVVAEGVETEAQLQFLKNEHCDELQGYLFSRPVPDKEFLAVLDRIGIKSSR